MQLRACVVRVYGTRDQYGKAQPRMCPAASPLVFEDFPEDGSRAEVHLGSVPPEIIEAELGRRAVGQMMLWQFTGADAEGSPDERFKKALALITEEITFEEFNWYVTFSASKTFELDDDVLPNGFAFPKADYVRGAELRQWAADALDVLTALASTILDERVFEEVVLEDRVLLFADGKHPAGFPHFTTSADLTVQRGDESIKALSGQLTALAEVDIRQSVRAHAWIAQAAHWYAAALAEADPWKRFLWSFVGLEVVAHKLFERFYGTVKNRLILDGQTSELATAITELVWTADRAPAASRFAVAAIELFPESASEDIALFRRLKKGRDELTHGSTRSADDLPQGGPELLNKYLGGAVKRLILAIPANAE
jgi:hypothetical protein